MGFPMISVPGYGLGGVTEPEEEGHEEEGTLDMDVDDEKEGVVEKEKAEEHGQREGHGFEQGKGKGKGSDGVQQQ